MTAAWYRDEYASELELPSRERSAIGIRVDVLDPDDVTWCVFGGGLGELDSMRGYGCASREAAEAAALAALRSHVEALVAALKEAP